MCCVLHNALLFVALLWAPRHFYWSSDEADRLAWTTDNVKSLFPKSLGTVYALLADNTELTTESSLNLILQSVLFSAKLRHLHTAKLFTVCATRRRIVWRAPLLGGVAKEITGLEMFTRSAEHASLMKSGVDAIYMFTDRGFRGLDAHLKATTHTALAVNIGSISSRRGGAPPALP